ncbi:MAG: hypothetical protein E4H00_10455, partial [Myxococcales bacterium]
MRSMYTLLLCAFALGLMTLACSGDGGQGTGTAVTTAETTLGSANGVMTEDGVVAFLGMPFAKPP